MILRLPQITRPIFLPCSVSPDWQTPQFESAAGASIPILMNTEMNETNNSSLSPPNAYHSGRRKETAIEPPRPPTEMTTTNPIAMYPDLDAAGRISILEMSREEAETLHTALMRILNDLPPVEQVAFRRLLIQLDKLMLQTSKTE
ncbi:hypothetical protein [uncultured Rikenella sp.]|uniref:hypothetical protein n=2 Tax=uncultured Rikenella sp. TaxID=368003 RepID=UPI0025F58C38|nr:hypothetical protein [uncultured Rikenella sp.]